MIKAKKNILFISYVFPPTGGAGIQRTVKLVKYFSRLGWNVSVLTAKNPSVPVKDTKMLEDIPNNVKIYRSITYEVPYTLKRKIWNKTSAAKQDNKESILGLSIIFRWIKKLVYILMMPDPQIGWVGSAYRAAKKIIRRESINYLFISAPPFSSLLLIPKLKNIKGIIKVADFRDEWSEFYLKAYDFHNQNTSTIEKILRLEKSVFQHADIITMATKQFVTNYFQKYPEQSQKIKVLTNGYDPDDFIHIKKDIEHSKSRTKIVYTGTVFNVTTLQYFLLAISNLIDKDLSYLKKIKIEIVGRITEEELIYFSKFRFQEILDIRGYLPHSESIKALLNSDILLVIIDELEGSQRIIAAKIFEYIYTKIPILGLVPIDGAVANIINETETGIVVSNRDIEGITHLLERFIERSINIIPNEKEINKYTRENIAKDLIVHLTEYHKRERL